MKEFKLRPIKFLWQLLNKTISEAKVSILGYRSYSALLTQTGTTPPTIVELENTLGGTPLWEYNNVGRYSATLTGAWANNKVGILTTSTFEGFTEAYVNDIDRIFVETFDMAGSNIDGVLYQQLIEIRIYN